MTKGRKYFGMTLQQVGILVGLGVLACLLFGVTGIFALRKGLSGLPSRAPAVTPTIRPTSTLMVIPSLTPTETATPVPYDQLIPAGWKQFKTGLIEIWLPPTFKSTNKAPAEELAVLGANSKKSLYKMRISISYEPLSGDSLDAHLDDRLSKMDPATRMVERRKVSLNSTEAVRMVFEGRVETVDVNELVFVMQDGSTVWSVVYVAQINEFYDMLPAFEQSIKTFRIVR